MEADMDGTDNRMTVEQAYRAMLLFLQREVDLTESSDLADLVSEYRIGADGQPKDAAVWAEWVEAVRQAVQGDKPA
jgi:hypothetical protein